LRRAVEVGAAAVVTGAIQDEDLAEFIGRDLGVAITGHEETPLTLILTEGFGEIRMAVRTWALLTALEGSVVSVNGATQIRAGVVRPELVAPHAGSSTPPAGEASSAVLAVGAAVRLIRAPWFGELATVTALPPAPQPIETGAVVRVLEARLADGRQVVVPRANVELLIDG
jgi:hypothetical protein